jgi:AcrR family transcriptional regulator
VQSATELLVDGGIDHVRVDVVAKRIGVTRGSFYWHFADLASFHQQLIDRWKATSTEEIIASIERLDIDASAVPELTVGRGGGQSHRKKREAGLAAHVPGGPLSATG